jgi:hypothetical protein
MATFTNAGDANDGIIGTTTSHDHNGVNGRNDDTTARNAATPEGNGVFGTTKVPDGAGIFGLHESNGVGVAGFGHPTGIGVVGISAPADAKGGDGVLGMTNSEHRNGIVGLNNSTVARVTAEPGGNGIFGFSQVPDGAGVFGSHGVSGIGVAGLGLIGVSGGSFNGVGVLGVSKPPGGTGAGDGVQGITNSPIRNGIYGLNESTDKHGTNDPGGNGVLGFSNVTDGTGVMGAHGNGGHGLYGTGGFGVTGTGTNIGVWGIGKGTGWAGYFSGPIRVEGATSLVGTVEVDGAHTVNGTGTVAGDFAITGNLSVAGDVQLVDRDIAERFEVENPSMCPPGTVMVIGETGALVPCSRRYDKRTVGVVSGAGTLRSAVTLGALAELAASASVALVGTAYCWVDANLAPIEIGDLVTTSDTVGHGMKATDPASSFGAVIGKALGSQQSGRGLVPILLSLQ